ncbi:MAG: hypothetical protein AB7D07_16095 [Desulfovibrionaceae bacterium]
MSIVIERQALQTMLLGVLSCQCPVDESVERELFRLFRADPAEEAMDVAPYMAVADKNSVRTPLHLFLEYCRYGRDDPHDFLIANQDAIRYFCSLFHYKSVLAGLDPVSIPDPASHVVGHMLLPVLLDGGASSGSARIGPHTVRLRNLFIPPEVEHEAGGWLGVHFGAAVTVLDEASMKIARDHLGLIEPFETLAGRSPEIDYANCQTFGDHRTRIAMRWERNR